MLADPNISGGVVGGGYTEGAKVYKDAAQAIPRLAWTVLIFDNEDYDTDVIHDIVTNNSRLICKTAGKYLLLVTVFFALDANTERWGQIRLNGTTMIHLGNKKAMALGATSLELPTIYDLVVNDYVEVLVYHDGVAGLDVINDANGNTRFMMQRIG